jgi:hypothetical protein
MPLQANLVRTLLGVDATGDVLAPFRIDEESVVTPHSRFGTVALNYRRRRATIALTALLDESSGGPGFDATVKEIMKQDGHFEPLLSGAMNVSGELLHIAAIAMGRSPQWLLSSLGDLFPTGEDDQTDRS